jgi:hypothetical protein
LPRQEGRGGRPDHPPDAAALGLGVAAPVFGHKPLEDLQQPLFAPRASVFLQFVDRAASIA